MEITGLISSVSLTIFIAWKEALLPVRHILGRYLYA